MPPNATAKLTLNADSIASLTNQFGNAELLRALSFSRYRRTIAGLLALRKHLCRQQAEPFSRIGVDRALELLFQYPAVVQCQILGYPTFALWVDLMLGLLAEPNPDTGNLKHVVAQIWRFVIACAYHADQGEFECCVPLDTSGRLFLPGTHTFLEFDNPRCDTTLRIDGASCTAHSAAGEIVSTCPKNLPVFGNCTEINAVDPDFRAASPDLRFQNLQPEDTVAWHSAAVDAWNLILSGSPSLADELSHFQVLVPILSDSPTTNVSGTVPKIAGTSFMSWTPNTPDLVETIIHEYHHQKLDLLLAIDPLIIGPTHEPLYYSPWRNDPRPLRGVLHGAYVFQSIYRFWADYFSTDCAHPPLLFERRVRARAYFIRRQVVEAIATMRSHAEFSPLGIAFMAGLESALDAISVEPPSGDRRRLLAMDELLRDHKKTWIIENPQRPPQALPASTAAAS